MMICIGADLQECREVEECYAMLAFTSKTVFASGQLLIRCNQQLFIAKILQDDHLTALPQGGTL